MSNLEAIQHAVSAQFGGPAETETSPDLTPVEHAALQRWQRRLTRARAGQNQVALPSGALVWA